MKLMEIRDLSSIPRYKFINIKLQLMSGSGNKDKMSKDVLAPDFLFLPPPHFQLLQGRGVLVTHFLCIFAQTGITDAFARRLSCQ